MIRYGFYIHAGNDSLPVHLNNNVVFQTFDKQNVFQVYFEIPSVGFDEDTFIFYILHTFFIFIQ